MNYQKIYNSIIEKAKNRSIQNEYFEKHHIVPKSMGGNNLIENLVDLYPKEHFICHHLLAKIYNNKEMWCAFSMMCISNKNQKRIIKFGKQYEFLKLKRSENMIGNKNHMFGKKSYFKNHTEESKEKIRLSKIGKKRNKFIRGTPSDETRLKLSVAMKGRESKLKGSTQPKYKCFNCHKFVNKGNLVRWHNEKCKSQILPKT